MMQAAVVSGSRIGVQSVQRPVARTGELLVRIQYAGVNPADWKRASGTPEDPAIGKPHDARLAIPGLDAAGVIERIGAHVQGYRVGFLGRKNQIRRPPDTILLCHKAAEFSGTAGGFCCHSSVAQREGSEEDLNRRTQRKRSWV